MTTPDSDTGSTASLSHEVKLLVDMVMERSAPWLARASENGTPDFDEHSADRPCVGWCPICTAVNAARGQGPEFTTRAFEQAAQAVALLRAVLADRWHPEQGVHMPGFDPQPAQPARPAATASQRPTEPAPNGVPQSSSARVQRFAVRKAEPGEHPS